MNYKTLHRILRIE